jgi:hypothetical protein
VVLSEKGIEKYKELVSMTLTIKSVFTNLIQIRGVKSGKKYFGDVLFIADGLGC